MNILIVRVSSLGDVVHNMPMVADIRAQFPHANIDWVVEEAYVDLVRLNPLVRDVLPFALRRWRKSLLHKETRGEIRHFLTQLRSRQYDVVFDTQGLLKTGVIMGMAKVTAAGQKVGLANGTEGSGYEPISRMFHTKSIRVASRTHAVMRGRIVAAQGLGYAVDTPPDFALQPPVEVARDWLPATPYAVLFHGTAGASKKWAQDHWVTIGNLLAAQGLTVLLPWGNPAEKLAAEFLAENIAQARVLPKLGMMDAVALAQKAAVVVGLDTGLTHIAAAYCRPTIELYCDSPRWKTEGNWSDNIINLGDKQSPPAVEQVIEALARLGFAATSSTL